MIMLKNINKQSIINLIVRIMPLFTLVFVWSGIAGVKQYSGLVYVLRNELTSIIGLIIIFGELLCNLKWKYKFFINLFGNIIFWLPLFYRAFKQTNNINNVTVMGYISIGFVGISCILQLGIIYKNKYK